MFAYPFPESDQLAGRSDAERLSQWLLSFVRLYLSKTSKHLSGWGLYSFPSSRRCLFLSRHFSQIYVQSSI